ncbi:16S rRNA (adenine(1518)-N(6)/adenine(1519)-N(6))-dimethyltransferase RsmA [Christensenellaceae bacterium OttesenSCG-928-M15]|nr:16S rRNA (adenine(1518)-N(6)/adenine(1519)-N(6))-dimethyltransferase RsmA [Christensenellaceae bacterium OttesenSCG-928-M15]
MADQDHIHEQAAMLPSCSVAGVKARLAWMQISPNKALGQNFLTDERLLNEMLAAMPPNAKRVLEIGPGFGALTEGLLKKGAKLVVAVEKDAAMVRALDETLLQHALYQDRLIVLGGDILTTPLSLLFGLLQEKPFYIYGNLPYYITTPAILRFLDCNLPIEGMTLMLQKEAADRFFALPGEKIYGPLTILAQMQYLCERGVELPPSAYFPQPEITSSVVHLRKKELAIRSGFHTFLKKAFAMRRKTLMNNLQAGAYSKDGLLQAFHAHSIAPNIRAEALSPEILYALYCSL